ncbi:MAG: DUF421 domain-containing protein [Caldilineaceae bacterium]|nr:DUF421 domain-containing protein [Caldilineaceae bacterium]MCB0143235.1 DUF421 domain-containing protein [Caldilineaceae bacterium]
MFDWGWIVTTWSSLFMIFVTALGLYIFLMLCVRLAGLRSFAKMSSFDFAITVATGSLLAATLLNKEPSLLRGMMGVFALFVIQYAVSWLRRHTAIMPKLVDNQPIILMVGPQVMVENLDQARMTVGDLNSHLRLAGVINSKQVLAVIMETTGDISILRADNENYVLEPNLVADVRDAESYFI